MAFDRKIILVSGFILIIVTMVHTLTAGNLYLIPTSLGDVIPSKYHSHHVLNTIQSLKIFIVENEKSARQFLKQCEIKTAQAEIIIMEIDKHDDNSDANQFLKYCENGQSTGLLSEAGVPAVADPGSLIVKRAHEKGIKVIPLTGPSSIILALMASGLNGQSFCFHGYLPIDKVKREQKIRQIENESRSKKITQIFIETPYRNDALFESLLNTCSPFTLLCIACNLTTDDELIITQPIVNWKKKKIDIRKKPAVFLIQG